MTRAICDGHSYEYEYNEDGRLKEKRSSGKRLISYEYDKAGQITAMTDPAGVTTCYEYDLLGRTSRIYTDQGMEVQYRYDCLNRLEQIVYGNGMKTCYQYDENGNVSYLETRMGEEKLLFFAYEYDGNGNRVSKAGEQSRIDGGSSHVRTTYQYNVRGQLLEEKRNEDTFCYSYDAAGNRIKKEDSKGDISYHYNEKNQLISEEGIRGRKFFTYNHQGSIIREDGPIETRSFTYNTRNQQVKVECEDGWTQVNRYDPEGLRYEMKENEKLFRFIYHRGELLYEGGKEEQTSYHLGGGTEAIQRNEKIYYYHKDEQLSTALITDEEGQVRNQYQYHAFGEEFETQESITNRIRYTGQQYDGVSGQYYLRARFYNPSLGRFMQEDPYHDDGLNLYAYCGNNPVTYYDPSGYTGQNPNSNCPPTANINGDGVENTKGTGEEISVPVTEEFYRTMSEKEYAKLLENEALTKRDKGASELKVTQESGYVTDDLSQRTNQGKKYTQIVKFEVDEGTKIVLESIGAAHPSVAENPIYASLPAVGTSEAKGMVEIKYEKNQTLSYGLGSSEKGLALFNENTKKISVLKSVKKYLGGNSRKMSFKTIGQLVEYYEPKMIETGKNRDFTAGQKLTTEFIQRVEMLNDVENEIIEYLDNGILTGDWKSSYLWIPAAITRPSERHVEHYLKMICINDSKVPFWKILDALAYMPKSVTSQIVEGLKESIELNNPSWSEEDLKKSFEVLMWIGDKEEVKYIEDMRKFEIPRIAEMAKYWDEWLKEDEDDEDE